MKHLFPSEYLKPGQLCLDAIYNPAKTRFLLDAEEVAAIMNSLGMSSIKVQNRLNCGVARRYLWRPCVRNSSRLLLEKERKIAGTIHWEFTWEHPEGGEHEDNQMAG